MTPRDNRTPGRAKGLWTGATMNSTAVPLGRKAHYGMVSGMHVLSLPGYGGCSWDAATYKIVLAQGMRTSRFSCEGRGLRTHVSFLVPFGKRQLRGFGRETAHQLSGSP